MPGQNAETLSETVRRLLRHGATSNLKNLLAKLHAADIAAILSHLEAAWQDQVMDYLKDSDQLPEIFSQVGSSFLASYLKRHPDYDAVIEVLQKIPSDDRTDLIGGLPEEISQEILGRMQMEQSQEVSDLLQYEEKTAGSLMSTEIFKLRETLTVGEAIRALQREAKKAVTIFYIYVVDEFNNLIGVVSIKQLFQVDFSTPLQNMMLRDIVKVKVNESQDEVARIVAQYDIVAVPVVDEHNKLVGVITVDDVIDVIKEEAAENVLKMGSAEGDVLGGEFRFVASLKKKIPWFLMLLLGGILTCEVIAYFYKFLPPVGIFAGFIPIILRFGGIIARQTSTIMIQGMASGGVYKQVIKKALLEQGSVNLVVAVVTGVVVGIYSFARFAAWTHLPFAVGIALFSSMMMALLFGVTLPILFNKMKLDPVLTTGSVINFLLDIVGLLIYFNILIGLLG